jgi:hypothetical protein
VSSCFFLQKKRKSEPVGLALKINRFIIYLLLSAANGNHLVEAVIKIICKKAGCVDVWFH